jgi:hypothetical protein
MKRAMLIFLSLVLALVGSSTVGAQVNAQDEFYVISGVKRNPAPVPKTGQTTSYAAGDDGTLKKGVAWPTPRFTDHGNGTVTDNLTGLIWLSNANTFATQTWANALSLAGGLASGSFGLSDGSKGGDWRLPNIRELQSLVDYGQINPALPNTVGTGRWTQFDPFTGVQSSNYWSSTTTLSDTVWAFVVNFADGTVGGGAKSIGRYVWCVRGGP